MNIIQFQDDKTEESMKILASQKDSIFATYKQVC